MAETYGYARCSTDENRQDISRQKRDLLALGVPDDEHIYWEYESGAKRNRPELAKLMKIVAPGDIIAATEVSRLTRSTQQLCEIMDQATSRHLCLVIGSLVIDCRDELPDPMTEAMLKVAGVFAEMERRMTSERVKSGIANARKNGVSVGRPRMTKARLPKDFWQFYDRYRNHEITAVQFARLVGVSESSIYRYMRIADSAPGKDTEQRQ